MQRKKQHSSSPGVSRGLRSIHYQVYAEFTLKHGKPQLVNTSIFLTKSACTSYPLFEKTVLKQSRIFPTLKTANSFISFLYGVYRHSPAQLPLTYPRYEKSGQILLL